MNVYKKSFFIFFHILAQLVLWGWIIPPLLSAKDDFLVVLGLFCLVLVFLLSVNFFKETVKWVLK